MYSGQLQSLGKHVNLCRWCMCTKLINSIKSIRIVCLTCQHFQRLCLTVTEVGHSHQMTPLSNCVYLCYSYRQAQASVLEGITRLQKLDIPTKRPDDYFAEMAKSDNHMKKVRFITTLTISWQGKLLLPFQKHSKLLIRRPGFQVS